MRKMLMWKAGLLFISIVIHLQLWAQKKWDGGGGDSLWNNSLNWHPNGIPSETDTVVLDNQWIATDYPVYLPDSMISSRAYSISIRPSMNQQIHFVIPASNTASPALILGSPDIAIEIDKGGIFHNNSGATAGNPISFMGKIKIMNGGKYLHQTQRGNAILISNLIASPETRHGIFEFNVPGNSAYTISASGRTFGSLVLNGQQVTRKTYTSSGSNKLNIEGDLIIHEQAGFSSSLTNTIFIGGDLQVKGRLYLNPVSGDSIGRDMVTNGPANTILVNGQFNQGIHFRNWTIEGGYAVKHSTIHIDHPSTQIQINTGSQIDLGHSMLKGLGRLTIDSNVHFYSSAPSIIDSDSLSNIQLTQLSIHPATKLTVYGDHAQKTGYNFPSNISSLYMNKQHEKLTISKSLTIDDSLLLNHGIIVVDESSTLTIEQYTNMGNDSSYVDGRLVQKNNKLSLYFPLGIDALYTPAQIKLTGTSVNYHEISVKRFRENDNIQQVQSPIHQLGSPVYWNVKRLHQIPEQELTQLELINSENNPLALIVQLDTVLQKWVPVSSQTHTTNQFNLISDTLPQSAGLFTIGYLEPTVLALNSITLKKIKNNHGNELQWIVNDDENASYYTVEAKELGGAFIPIDTVVSVGQKGKHSYYKQLNREKNKSLFFRICGIDQDENKHYSNVVYNQGLLRKLFVYPNPTNYQLSIKTMEKIKKIEIIDTKGSRLPATFHAEKTNYTVSVNHLKPGNYFLRLYLSNGMETISFIKQ